MKVLTLRMTTVILFGLIPIVILLRLFYDAPHLEYGEGDITLNSVVLLLFAVYAFFVSNAHLRKCHNYWDNGDAIWKKRLTLTYSLIFIVVLLLPFFMACQELISWSHHNYINEYDLINSVFNCLHRFSQNYIGALCFVSPAFLFPIGVVLFFLGCAGAASLKGRSKSYLIVIFFTSLIFVLICAVPAFVVFVWWLKGGINLAVG